MMCRLLGTAIAWAVVGAVGAVLVLLLAWLVLSLAGVVVALWIGLLP